MNRRYPYADVLEWAEHLRRLLDPACEQIMVAGSLRRKRPTVKDIEIVAIPKALMQPPAFGVRGAPPANALEVRLREMEAAKQITRNVAIDPALWKWGARFKKLALLDQAGRKLPWLVDLFIVLPPAQWGSLLAIRTGPNDWNKAIMTYVLPRRGLKQMDGHLETPSGRVLDTPTEAGYFAALGMPLVPPPNRKVWLVGQMLDRVEPYEQPADEVRVRIEQPGLF